MREHLVIEGGIPLRGTVEVSGAKNAALPLLMATLLSSGQCVLSNVPLLEDIAVTVRLLRGLGAEVTYNQKEVTVRVPSISSSEAPAALVKAMRASFWVLAPVLARSGEARVALPGGDAIGVRPVDLHLKGLVRMGADVRLEHGFVVAHAPGGLRAANIDLDYPSVGATHQLLMAAALTPGETVITGAAREPEVEELAQFLSQMGAEIDGAGTPRVVIRGREELGGSNWRVLGDRIESATYLCAAAATGGDVTVQGIDREAIAPVLEVLEMTGCQIICDGEGASSSVRIIAPRELKAVDVETNPFPGFPTDAQPPMLALLTLASGQSRVTETVFESRFGHVAEYRKFGAKIEVSGRTATLTGVGELRGAAAEGGDIRAVAGLTILALAAKGRSEIYELHHLDRGYERLTDKFSALGASLTRIHSYDAGEVVIGC